MTASFSPPSSRARASFAYWAAQIVGWAAWCGAGLFMMRRQLGGLPASVVTGYALFFLFAIAVTHGLRHVIRRRAWLALAPASALLRLAGAGIGLGLVLTGFVALTSFVQHGADSDFRRPAALGVLAANLIFGAALWTAGYAGLSTWLRQREERQRAAALEHTLAAARVKALEAQISPHFLFNCLNSLRGMIGEDSARAQDMVTRLANILRHNLALGADATTEPLSEQIEVATDYLALEAVRFDERLRTRFVIDAAARDCRVPAMLLQTLVENAIKHGIARLPAGGEVVVAAAVTENVLHVTVENTGTLRPMPPADSTSVGLANLRERLRLLCGAAARLELMAVGGNRVRATVALPASAAARPAALAGFVRETSPPR